MRKFVGALIIAVVSLGCGDTSSEQTEDAGVSTDVQGCTSKADCLHGRYCVRRVEYRCKETKDFYFCADETTGDDPHDVCGRDEGCFPKEECTGTPPGQEREKPCEWVEVWARCQYCVADRHCLEGQVCRSDICVQAR